MRLLPAVDSTVARRLLINYRITPDVVAPLLPADTAPQLVNGYAIAGICLIHLDSTRPKGFPRLLGLSTQNVAHRIAILRSTTSGTEPSVFIPRRDTSSRLVSLLGGRLFPGVHHKADFSIDENEERLRIAVNSRHDGMRLEVDARPSEAVPAESVFSTLAEASDFFRNSPSGYSPAKDASRLESVRLETNEWRFEAARVTTLMSSFFDDRSRFAESDIAFDSAFLMRNVKGSWHP